jgi:catechol 2,3-dioxygenase-like lactoylglutathione lyase family enzyme
MAPLDYVFTHVHVYASDPDATVAWFTDGLGGHVVARRQHGGYPVATDVRLGDQIVQIRGRRDEEHFADAGPRTFGLDHVGLSVEDVDATVAALAERGIAPESGGSDGFHVPEGVVFVKGPDGVRVEITSLEHVPAPRDVFTAGRTSTP